jgi:hypothetical protein
MHPGVKATLSDRIGSADDMSPEDWNGFRDGFLKFIAEEEDEPEHADDAASGKLNEKERAEADRGEKDRAEMPESAFLEPATRKYPVKAKVDGEWKYTSNLLLAAARRARMEKDESLAKRADEIRAKEFGGGEDEITATDSALTLALDKESVREKDRDGRLHISVTHVCKACVSPYLGHEIPGWQELNLTPDRIYKMLRPAEELKKAAPTINGVQLLRKHIPVSASDHQPWDVAGAVGTTAEWNDPWIDNGLTIWSAEDIKRIESGEKAELSPGYHYDPVMEPGEFDGEDYSGRMTNIVFNHVSIVENGRQPGVVIGDSAEELQWAIVESALSEFMLNA